MEKYKSRDERVLELCTRAIQAEGKEFEAAMAELRKHMWDTSHDMENATLASVLKASKVVKAAKKKAPAVEKEARLPKDRAA